MERCDGYRGGVRRYGKVRQLTGSVTVIKEMRKVLERWVSLQRGVMVMRDEKEMWEGVTVVRKCASPTEVCQLVGRCDGHGQK